MKESFPLIAFTADTVARLTGLTIRQLHHWDRRGFFHPSFADPHRRRPHSRVYSFSDVVGLRTIARLKRQGASFPSLKRVREFFASGHNEDWGNRSFYVVGKRVFFSHEDAILAADPLGQRVDIRILELGPIVNDVRDEIRRLPLRDEGDIGEIVTDRFIMDGAPIMAGTRIPASTIYWFHEHGYSDENILGEFPRLRPLDIERAIAYETKRRQDQAQHLVAAS